VQVVAIADPDQAIYAWRGAHVDTMLGAFRREYRPREFQLRQNFRCTPDIIAAANAVIGENRTSPPTTAISLSGTAPHLPVDLLSFTDEEAEAEKLVHYIERAVHSGRYSYGDIAVLYRTHGRADLAAALLPQHGLPIARVEPGRFFGQQDVQEGLRYLELLLALRDDHFVPALNWPRVLVDEVTMVHLRRLARREGTTLCDLANRIEPQR
jgi:DNA helicase-2/ATP-dependent DNA helicase PcrA